MFLFTFVWHSVESWKLSLNKRCRERILLSQKLFNTLENPRKQKLENFFQPLFSFWERSLLGFISWPLFPCPHLHMLVTPLNAWAKNPHAIYGIFSCYVHFFPTISFVCGLLSFNLASQMALVASAHVAEHTVSRFCSYFVLSLDLNLASEPITPFIWWCRKRLAAVDT